MDSAIQTLEKAIQQLLSLGAVLIVIAIAISIIPYILYANRIKQRCQKMRDPAHLVRMAPNRKKAPVGRNC